MEPDSSIYTDYFRITRESQEKYGPRTVLFMQVGAFFEIYGTKEPGGEITRSPIVDVCTCCGGLAISEKKTAYGKGQLVMAGFRDYTLDKHVQKMMDADYTVVVYVQVKTGTKFTRELSNVFSPGTFLSSDTDSAKTTNNIMCIWVERFGQKMVCGLANINIFTGKSEMFEYETAYELTPGAFDDLERAVSVHSPCEVILVSDLDEAKGRTVLQYSGVKCRSIHRVHATQDAAASRCAEQKYLRHVITAFFKEDTVDVCQEFHMYPIATQAFCYLLNFVQEHTPSLVKRIDLPTFYNASTSLVLANHTLKQLNIIDDAAMDTGQQLRSVASFLNKCCSALGRRRFYSQLVNPTFDTAWLETEYLATARMLEAWDLVDPFRKICREICDLEKMGRQLVSRKLVPESVFRLYKSVCQIQQIHVCLAENREIMAYLISSEKTDNPFNMVETWVQTVLDTISRHLCIETCAGILSQTSFDQNIIKEGVSPSLDDLVKRKRENEDMFDQIRVGFNRIMATQEGVNLNNYGKTDYVRVHETEKSGSSLQLTKKRSGVLKKYLAEQMKSDPQSKLQFGKIHVLVSEIRLVAAGSSNDDIEFPLLTRICREILSIKDEMNGAIAKAYAEFLTAFERDALLPLTQLSNYISRLDVLQCKAYIARNYGYTRPRIDESTYSSYVDVRGLRHCLIEQIQTSELYVANDIRMSSSGILLYGTNAVGKTSLIRALGIAIVMAQAGLYVPASNMVYRPFKAIYSRILGNDNLFKNLSTFAVEMSELRVILNHADESSLVLGDELCSGTESESALSIFMAGLMHLSKRGTAFIFATHFHEITRFAEMKALLNVELKHMAVHYDRELDALVYDRVLKDGQGDKVYGLEVAKSLHLPDAFLEEAYRIRNTYFPDTRGALAAQPSPKYNAQKLKGVCEKCFVELAQEVHHLQEQRLADEAGFIEGVYKNHPANLMALCEKCHREEHANVSSDKKIVKKKTTKGIAVK